jgi:tetratricopeptide (TPR) repeat protein
MTHEDIEREPKLRHLIVGGSCELSEYVELAGIVFARGAWEEALSILTNASRLDWPQTQRGFLLNLIAQILTGYPNRFDEAVFFAGQAVSILSAEPQTSEVRVATCEAGRLIAQYTCETDPPRSNQVAVQVISTIRGSVEIETDPRIVCALCRIASWLLLLLDQREEAISWMRRAVAQPLPEREMISPYADLGTLLQLLGKHNESKKALHAALDLVLRSLGPPVYDELSGSKGIAAPVAHFKKPLEIGIVDRFLRTDLNWVSTLYLEIGEVCRQLEDFISSQRQIHSIGPLASCWAERRRCSRNSTRPKQPLTRS